MKQFYYTSCLAGESVSGQSGFQIRAASGTLSQEETTACLRALNFKLNVPSSYLGPFPVKMLYCRSERTGNIALQSVWLGEDPLTKRSGNYVSHVLCGLLPEISAKTVLEWWGSPEWKRENSGIESTELPEPTEFSPGEMFSDAIFEEMQNDAELFAIWEFLIRAWWNRPASGRIFVAAEQEKFVKALWGLCRILPAPLWNALSFSTYEQDAMLSPANVVGLWDLEKPANSIPQNCFQGTNAAWNVFSDQKSPLKTVPNYVEFLISSVKTGKFTEADSFHANAPAVIWERRDSAEMFFELVRHPDTLDITRLKEIAHLPNIGKFLMKNPKRLQMLLENFFSSKLLDVWENESLKETFSPFFAEDEVIRSQFRDGVHALIRRKITQDDVSFLDRIFTRWLSKFECFALGSDDFWLHFNAAPQELPENVYQWAYPRAFQTAFLLSEPSFQINFLSRWAFRGDDARCEPQMEEIFRSPFPHIVKLELYRRFFEIDLAGNDEKLSDLYFTQPKWNVQLLAKLSDSQRQEFLRHTVPVCGQALLEALQDHLLELQSEKKSGNEELFAIYCWLLTLSSITVTESVGKFAKKLSPENLAHMKEAVSRRKDIEQLIQMKTLRPIFEEPAKGLGAIFKMWGRN